MKWKLWVRSLSVSGPRVAVRPQLPLFLRLLIATATLASAFAAGFLARGVSSEPADVAPAEDIAELRTQLTQAIADRDREAAAAANWESRLAVERAAQEQVATQMKALADENARIREDLAFFESLLPTAPNAKGVVIRSFRLQPDGDGSVLRYRLLVQQSGRPERDFVGNVNLTVNFEHEGRHEALHLPDPAVPATSPATLSFRHYQRVEGSFSVPAGAIVRSVLVRIDSNGETRAQQTFTM
jgi:hypothetical protein